MTPTVARLQALLRGYTSTQALYVAARLGLPDALAEGPSDAASLARRVGADPDGLHRLLRGLAQLEIVTEEEPGRFALAEAGEALRTGAPGDLRTWALLTGELFYDARAGLLDAVRTGASPFAARSAARTPDDRACERPDDG